MSNDEISADKDARQPVGYNPEATMLMRRALEMYQTEFNARHPGAPPR